MERDEFEHAMRNWIDGIRFAAEVLAESNDSEGRRQMLDHILSGAHACSGLLKQYVDQDPARAETLSSRLLATISPLS